MLAQIRKQEMLDDDLRTDSQISVEKIQGEYIIAKV